MPLVTVIVSILILNSVMNTLIVIMPFCHTPVIGLGLGVDFTFTWDKKNNDNDNNNDKNNPHINFLKETVLGDREQGLWIRDKG